MKTQVQLIDAKNAGPKKIYLEFLPGYHCKKAQEYYDQEKPNYRIRELGKRCRDKI